MSIREFMVYVIWNFNDIIMFLEFTIILKPKYKNWITIIVGPLLLSFLGLARMLDISNMVITRLIMVPSLIFIFAYVIFMFKDSLGKKILAVMITIITIYSTDFIMSVFFGKLFISDYEANNITNNALFVLLMGIVIEMIFMAIIIICWKLFVDKNDVKRYIIFLIFPISQMINMVFTMISYDYREIGNVNSSIGILVGILADLILFYNIFTQAKKEELDRKLREYQYMEELQINHFKTIQANYDTLSKLRHDYNGHLQTILLLLENDNKEKVLEMIDSLKIELEKIKNGLYCGNVIVNAILSEKEYECNSLNIYPEYDIELDDNLYIENIHLCSVFSNLIDNAVNACIELPIKQRMLSVKAKKQGDYVIVKVINSTSEEHALREKRLNHGYGTQIISDIAEKYHGKYSSEYNNGEYIAIVLMMNIASNNLTDT